MPPGSHPNLTAPTTLHLAVLPAATARAPHPRRTSPPCYSGHQRGLICLGEEGAGHASLPQVQLQRPPPALMLSPSCDGRSSHCSGRAFEGAWAWQASLTSPSFLHQHRLSSPCSVTASKLPSPSPRHLPNLCQPAAGAGSALPWQCPPRAMHPPGQTSVLLTAEKPSAAGWSVYLRGEVHPQLPYTPGGSGGRGAARSSRLPCSLCGASLAENLPLSRHGNTHSCSLAF